MPAGRVEVITSTERRRSYTDAERDAILAECAEPDGVIAAVARRYGIAESLIYGRRSKRRAEAALASEPLQFIPYGAVVEAPAALPAPVPAPEPPHPVTPAATAPAIPPSGALRSAVGAEPGAIVVELPTGVRLTMDTYVNEKALRGCCAPSAGRHDPDRARHQGVPGLQARGHAQRLRRVVRARPFGARRRSVLGAPLHLPWTPG